jgi:ribosomal protein S18 acetylase RimI-like enzyme
VIPQIRRATAADAAAATAITRAAYLPWVPIIGREPGPMSTDLASSAEAGELWVAEDGGEAVGVLVLVPHPDHLLLESVAVAPDAQGRGIGSALLRVADEQAAAAGLPEVRLYTHERMTTNIRRYERSGYRETHREQQAGFARVFLTKRIGSQAKSASGADE